MLNGVDAQIVSDAISPPADLTHPGSTGVRENTNMSGAFVENASFLLPLSRLNAVEMLRGGV